MFGFGLIYCYASPELNHFEIKGIQPIRSYRI